MAGRLLSSHLRRHLLRPLPPPNLRNSPSPPPISGPLRPSPALDLLLLRPLSSGAAHRRPRPSDIGARARRLQSKRLWTYALTFSSVAAFITIVLSQFQDQLVFYLTPTDALQKFAQNPKANRCRLGGLVLEGSLSHPSPNSPEMEFVVTDLVTDVLVRYEGALPDLFREGHSCVVEGFLKPFEDSGPRGGGPKVSDKARGLDCFFMATEVLAKHDEKYMPAEVANALERNKKMLEEEAKVAVAASAAPAAAGESG